MKMMKMMMMTMMMMKMMMIKEIKKSIQRKKTKETRNSQRGTMMIMMMMMMMMRDTTPEMRITTTKRTDQTKGSMKESIKKGNMRKGEFYDFLSGQVNSDYNYRDD